MTLRPRLVFLVGGLLAVGFVIVGASPRQAAGPLGGALLEALSPLRDSMWTADLAPPDGGAGITGSGALEPAGAKSATARVRLAGAKPGATYPWHVHIGRCGQSEGIFGPPGEYPPVKVGDDGTGEATASLSAPTPTSGDYFVNVHASPSAMKTIAACGNLKKASK